MTANTIDEVIFLQIGIYLHTLIIKKDSQLLTLGR